MKREEFRVIYDQGPDAVFALVETLFAQIAVLAERVRELGNPFVPNCVDV